MGIENMLYAATKKGMKIINQNIIFSHLSYGFANIQNTYRADLKAPTPATKPEVIKAHLLSNQYEIKK